MAVKSRKQIISLVREHEMEIGLLGAKRLALFSSFIRGEQTDSSDVDILVEFYPDRKTFESLMRLASFLEGIFDRRVDLVTSEALSPFIRPYVLEEANLSISVLPYLRHILTETLFLIDFSAGVEN